jgi:acetyltransferase-like isoleucine patch superfamily enzyme
MARARATTSGLVFEGPCFLGPDVRFEVAAHRARLVVGAFCHIGQGARLRAHEGTLRIGEKSIVGIGTTVNCWLDVEIGRQVLIGDDCYVCDFDHRTDAVGVPIRDQGIVKTPVRIGDDCWLGTKVVVTRGTVVGDHSVLAAGCVARGTYPPYAVVAGVPGRVVRRRAP